MSFIRVYIHTVWETKNRFPFLTSDIKSKVINHIKENATKKKIFIDTIDGSKDHIHCLFCLNADMSISTALQLMKGESSHWINLEHLTKSKFGWGEDYFAESVSPSDLERVRKYIRNQEEHHRKMTFKEEVEAFLKKFGFGGQG